MIHVTHYGIHFAGADVAFLIQRRSATSLYPGLPCPFQMHRHSHSRACPHLVDLVIADDTDQDLLSDPLAAWTAAPVGVAVVHDPRGRHTALVERLLEMYNPTRPSLAPSWAMSQRKAWIEEAACSNLSPWCVFASGSQDLDRLKAIADHYPRPVLALSKEALPMFPGAQRLETSLTVDDLNGKNLPGLGAWSVRQRMLNGG